jgi:hypothetical protein
LSQCAPHFERIESAFEYLTADRLDNDGLRYFFNSWSQTNNSAATLSGYCNRLSRTVQRQEPLIEPKDLFKIIYHLHRVTDEDLGVGGGIIHYDLFYRMASFFCEGDAWLSRRYTSQAASDFRLWKEHTVMREPDLMYGLLVTVIHELATHGEVEFIRPLFEKWLTTRPGPQGKKARDSLAWIRVHCGGTEKDHFYHALQALEFYCKSTGKEPGQYPMRELFENYLKMKAVAMESVSTGQIQPIIKDLTAVTQP